MKIFGTVIPIMFNIGRSPTVIGLVKKPAQKPYNLSQDKNVIY